jgi:hypothetical protein
LNVAPGFSPARAQHPTIFVHWFSGWVPHACGFQGAVLTFSTWVRGCTTSFFEGRFFPSILLDTRQHIHEIEAQQFLAVAPSHPPLFDGTSLDHEKA